MNPSECVLGGASLDGGKRVVDFHRGGARIARVAVHHLFAFVCDGTHRAHHHGGASCEHLVRIQQLGHGYGSLLHVVSLAPRKLDDGLPRNAGQDGPSQWRSLDRLALANEDVARRHLLDVLVLHGVEVKYIRVSLLFRGKLRDKHRRVVSCSLGSTHAAGSRSVEVLLHHQLDGRQLTTLEVGTDGRAVHEKCVRRRRPQSENRPRSHEKRAEVQRSLSVRWHVARVRTHRFLDATNEHLLGHGRHGHARGTRREPRGVLRWPEEKDISVG
mmetsp:Transcript_5786/g.15091  ORF Transcript_5786/g.15091 Transcript_5786/m.15091 type:complete len:272 (+) Transcript_5786:2235-3050(+)